MGSGEMSTEMTLLCAIRLAAILVGFALKVVELVQPCLDGGDQKGLHRSALRSGSLHFPHQGLSSTRLCLDDQILPALRLDLLNRCISRVVLDVVSSNQERHQLEHSLLDLTHCGKLEGFEDQGFEDVGVDAVFESLKGDDVDFWPGLFALAKFAWVVDIARGRSWRRGR